MYCAAAGVVLKTAPPIHEFRSPAGVLEHEVRFDLRRIQHVVVRTEVATLPAGVAGAALLGQLAFYFPVYFEK